MNIINVNVKSVLRRPRWLNPPCVRHKTAIVLARPHMLYATRRSWMASLVSWPLVFPIRPSIAADDDFTAPVRAALSPNQYLDIIRASAPSAISGLQNLIERGKFKEACEALLIDQADALIQAVFYLPWSYLERGEESQAVKALALSDRFKLKVDQFTREARQAASFVGEEEDVARSLAEMKDAVNNLEDAFL